MGRKAPSTPSKLLLSQSQGHTRIILPLGLVHAVPVILNTLAPYLSHQILSTFQETAHTPMYSRNLYFTLSGNSELFLVSCAVDFKGLATQVHCYRQLYVTDELFRYIYIEMTFLSKQKLSYRRKENLYCFSLHLFQRLP